MLAVNLGPQTLILFLFLLLKDPSEPGDQGGRTGCHTPGMLLLNRLDQIGRILVAVCGRGLQRFQSFFPVSPDSVSEKVDPAQLVFRIRIAILRCRLEVVDGLFDVLPAFLFEVDLSC